MRAMEKDMMDMMGMGFGIPPSGGMKKSKKSRAGESDSDEEDEEALMEDMFMSMMMENMIDGGKKGKGKKGKGPTEEEMFQQFVQEEMFKSKNGGASDKMQSEMEMCSMMADLMAGPSGLSTKPSKSKQKNGGGSRAA